METFSIQARVAPRWIFFVKLHLYEADRGCEGNRWLVIIFAQAFITEMERTV